MRTPVSGKTAVMAHWLVKTLRRMKQQADLKIWAVFANQSLSGLIWDNINEVWTAEGEKGPFPTERVELWHIGALWQLLNIRMPADDRFDYNGAAKIYLARNATKPLPPLCHAMFIDEAQDLGPSALELLSQLVVQSDGSNANTRSVNIFYDNAQNLYGRPTPKWSEMGLDMRGRSFVMQESFRSTKPITASRPVNYIPPMGGRVARGRGAAAMDFAGNVMHARCGLATEGIRVHARHLARERWAWRRWLAWPIASGEAATRPDDRRDALVDARTCRAGKRTCRCADACMSP